MKTLYLQADSGISGDMTVAALLDLGANEEKLLKALDSLQLDCKIKISKVNKRGFAATDFDVIIDHHHHEHHEHEHNHEHNHEHEHDHEHNHNHNHSHNHEHDHHSHSHHNTNLADILQLIENAEISDRAKKTAADIFRIIAKAEAKVHGVSESEIHFHEVGAVDSIADIVAAAVCLDDLDIGKVICTPLPSGSGTVKCQHGEIPVPAPATMEIATGYGIPIKPVQIRGELVTPTGAAIVAAVTQAFSLSQAFVVEKSGCGAGKKDFEHPNILRAFIIREDSNSEDTVTLLETNIDDQTPESLSFASERIFEEGALDCWFTPIYMKKNRPAVLLSVLCANEDKDKILDVIFKHTTTRGVRISLVARAVAEREFITAKTRFGDVTVKKSVYKGNTRYAPEYESISALAREHTVTLDEVAKEALKEL